MTDDADTPLSLPDQVDTLADLGDLIAQRVNEMRRMLDLASEALNIKFNEIDRLMLSAGRMIEAIKRTVAEGSDA